VTIVLDSLKKTLDDIAVLVQFRIKVMLNSEIGFVGNTSNGYVLNEENANLPAGQYHIATRRLFALSKPNRHFDAPYKRTNQ